MAVRLRTLAALAAGAIVAPLLPFAALPAYAEGEATPPASQSFVDFCVNVPADYEPFGDVDDNRFKDAIECLAFARVTRGLQDNQYGPDVEVNRAQMASFIAQLIDTADRLDTGNNIRTLPPYDGSPSFSDIDGNTHEANISRLADAGIVRGSNGSYTPNGPVTRDQMATFINAALDYMTGEPGATSDDYFTDDTGNTHEDNINAITSLGIATGDGRDSYAPRTRIDRDNMAAFLARTLGELEERGDIGPAVATQDIQVSPDSEATFDAVTNPDTSTADDRSYTATGLVPGEEYRVTLVEATTISETSSGEATFTDSDNDNLAEVGTRTADITQVNGSAAQNNTGDGTQRTATDSSNGGTAVGTADSNGDMTFVVDGDADGEAVQPLVYRNGGSGNTAEEGGTSPRLELNDDGTPAEPFDLGGVVTFSGIDASTAVTDGPDLVSAQFVRNTGTGDDEVTTVRYTFDEPVIAGVDEDEFFLYTFDGSRITADDDDSDLNDPNDARRDTADESSVLVVFPVTGADFQDVTLGAVDRGAVEDSDGNVSPIADASLGNGVTFTAGVTDAPDLVSIGNFRPSTATTTATLVDFTFDEPAFVANRTAGQFQLIQPDGGELDGTPANNTATVTDTTDVQGDGTNTITVSFPNEDGGSVAITAPSVVRGVVLEGTVSDEDQV
ncbi:MAG: S-layer homology domain-containing protein, partial [Actinomycetota bacterium]|nr:S-layer homology domain-containing protein [Actinomycetota bacterium]